MKRFAFICLAAATACVALAQETDTVLTHSVDIEKEYTPQVELVKRLDIELPTTEPKVEKSAVKYSSETQPLHVESQFYALPPSDPKNLGRPTYRPGFVRFGVGFPFNWLVDFYSPVVNNKTDFFDVQLNHFGIKNGTKMLIDTDFDLNYAHKAKKGKLYANIGFDNSHYSVDGKDSIFDKSVYYIEKLNRDVSGLGLCPETRTTTKGHAVIGFGSEKERNGWSYDARVSYELMTSFPTIEKENVKINRPSLREHNIGANIFGGYNIKGHRINADLGFNAFVYSRPKQSVYLLDSILPTHRQVLRDSTFNSEPWNPQFLITFNPRYENRWGNVSLRAGAKLWFSLGKDNLVAAAPDVEVRYSHKNIFDIYGGVGGEYTFTSLAETLLENRYFDLSERLEKNDYTPADFFLGINVTPVSGLSIDANVSYKIIENTHFFYNQVFACTNTPNLFPKSDLESVYARIFTIEDAKAHLLTAELRLMYNLKDRYNFHAKGRYNGWFIKSDGVLPWHKPAVEVDAGIEALFTKNFAMNANFYYGSERKAKVILTDGSYRIETLKPIYDLNLSLSYTFAKNWSLFLQANNMLSFAEKLRYQQWYGYDNIGAHVLLGASISF